jgi:hypothetical protein
LEGEDCGPVASSGEKVNEPKHPPLVKRNKAPARLFAQGWLPFQKIRMRRTPDRGKMPGLA